MLLSERLLQIEQSGDAGQCVDDLWKEAGELEFLAGVGRTNGMSFGLAVEAMKKGLRTQQTGDAVSFTITEDGGLYCRQKDDDGGYLNVRVYTVGAAQALADDWQIVED